MILNLDIREQTHVPWDQQKARRSHQNRGPLRRAKEEHPVTARWARATTNTKPIEPPQAWERPQGSAELARQRKERILAFISGCGLLLRPPNAPIESLQNPGQLHISTATCSSQQNKKLPSGQDEGITYPYAMLRSYPTLQTGEKRTSKAIWQKSLLSEKRS